MALTLDVFGEDIFGVAEMTDSINKAPFQPRRIDQMGLFTEKSVPVTKVWLEEKRGTISILPTAPRGAPATLHNAGKREGHAFEIPHVPYNSAVLAEAVQNVRPFGKKTELQVLATVVNDELEDMRDSHEATIEYHRVGALQGNVLDADGSSSIINLFTEWGITRSAVDFVLGTDGTDVRLKLLAVKRLIELALGGATYDHVHGFAGATWFDKYIGHPKVETAYNRWREGEFLRSDPRFGFPLAGVIIEEYRGKIGSVNYVPPTEVQLFPVGVRNLFRTTFGPGTTIDTVNTMGQRMFAMQEIMRGRKGTEISTEHNALSICTRPGTLIRGHTSN